MILLINQTVAYPYNEFKVALVLSRAERFKPVLYSLLFIVTVIITLSVCLLLLQVDH